MSANYLRSQELELGDRFHQYKMRRAARPLLQRNALYEIDRGDGCARKGISSAFSFLLTCGNFERKLSEATKNEKREACRHGTVGVFLNCVVQQREDA